MASQMPNCYTKSLPKAAKEHLCCECGGVIRKGETYQRVSGIWDGSGATFKTCLDCATLRQEICDEVSDPDEFPAFGELEYHCMEFGGDLEKRYKANRRRRLASNKEARG